MGLSVTFAYRATSAPNGMTSKNATVHSTPCTKLAAEPPPLSPSAPSSAFASDSLSSGWGSGAGAGGEGGVGGGESGGGGSAGVGCTRVRLSEPPPNFWCIAKLESASVDAGGVLLNAQMMSCIPSGGACDPSVRRKKPHASIVYTTYWPGERYLGVLHGDLSHIKKSGVEGEMHAPRFR